jgi:hypothetical protein
MLAFLHFVLRFVLAHTTAFRIALGVYLVVSTFIGIEAVAKRAPETPLSSVGVIAWAFALLALPALGVFMLLSTVWL